MRSTPGVSAKFFKALADAGINIEMISTSEIRVSAVTRVEQLEEAVRAVHTPSASTRPRTPSSTAPAAESSS